MYEISAEYLPYGLIIDFKIIFGRKKKRKTEIAKQ